MTDELTILPAQELEPIRDTALEAPQADPFAGLAVQAFPSDVQAILASPLTDDEIAVRPDDGELYIPGVLVRQRLNKAFGIGGWGIRPVSTIVDRDAKNKKGDSQPKVFYTGHLVCLGRFVAEATGEGNWITTNPKSDYGTALESAKTNCIMRCCKDLGIGWQLWDKSFSGPWKAKHCVNRNGNWEKRPPQPVKAPPNVPAPRVGGVGAWPKNKDHEKDPSAALDAQYAATMGSGPIPPDPAKSPKHRKGARAATPEDMKRVLETMLPEGRPLQRVFSTHGDEVTIEVEDAEKGETTYEPKASNAQLAKIHVLVSELQISDADYRHGLKAYYKIDSAAIMTKDQASNMIERLEKTRRNAEQAGIEYQNTTTQEG